VTDVRMPVLDGFQLAAELRRDKRTRKIPLIFSSGETTADDEARALRLGAIAYLAKQLDPAVLAALVTGALGRA
jgi:CheY-like chemotaxis protein